MTEINHSITLKFRKFNRFYTNVLGFLNEHIYDSPFSLTETRILFEIHNTADCTAKLIQDTLGLDRGYVSRILKRFEKENMVYKKRSEEDSRNHYIYLTSFGESIYKKLEAKANQQIEYMLKHIDGPHQEKLTEAMNTIESILSEHLPPEKSDVSIRDYYISDDIKLMIEKQRAFYAETHGWDDSFLDYLHETFDADIENIWIAESAGRFAGCVGLKDNQFERIFLWTVSTMAEARPLYEKFGFRLTEVKDETLLWGQRLREERWDAELG